ncbi:DUF348 domain-containing protein [Candidatus Saccharibacteria bacterium]|nr:DUF348 domain-containing protein [Candidatus Saccharibacteria bacterium]MBI3338251.1 DUF348 domain-containing protein [Candidatus Saccharibacteria bacterium]
MNNQQFRNKKIKHHPLVIPVLTFMVLFFATWAGFISLNGQTIGASDSHLVSINIDGKEQIVPSRAKTVGELLLRAGVVLNEHDKIEPTRETPITEDNFQINIYRARPITIVDGDKKIVALSAQPTPREVAKEAGLTIYPEDIVKLTQPDDILKDGTLGQKAIIDRATPIKLNLYGKTYDLRTHAVTVNELIKEQHIDVAQISVFPSPGTALAAGSVVFVTLPDRQIVVMEEVVPQTEVTINDYSLTLGQTEIREPGQPGKRVVAYEVATDGSRKLLQEIIVVQPVRKLVVRGRKIDKIFDGSFEAALAQLRACEAGGNYANKRNPVYRGAYQFNFSTWANYGGYYDPADAPPIIQDQKTWETYLRRGWQPWPACSIKLGLQDAYR